MEPGRKRTSIARIAAGFGCLSGTIGLLVAITNDPWRLTPHGWGIGGMLLLLIALFVLVYGVVSFEKFRPRTRIGGTKRRSLMPSTPLLLSRRIGQ